MRVIMDNDELLAEALTNLAEVYPRYELTPSRIDRYIHYLRDLPVDVALAAIEAAPTSYTFFPSVAELRSLVTESVIDRDAELDRAWIEVQREARRCGVNRGPTFHHGEFIDPPQPRFSSPLIAQAVESVGWRSICLQDRDTSDIGEQFKRAYRRVLTSAARSIQQGRAGHDLRSLIPDPTGSVQGLREGGRIKRLSPGEG